VRRRLFLMRGLPGSGKSTLALQLADNDSEKIFSTDEYWEVVENRFNGALLIQAHKWNQERTKDAMKKGITPIVIDNTNVVFRDALPYLEMAKAYGYHVEIREPETPWAKNPEILVKKNKHGVPIQTIQKMLNKYENHLFWNY
jgi:predicted kinase